MLNVRARRQLFLVKSAGDAHSVSLSAWLGRTLILETREINVDKGSKAGGWILFFQNK